MSRPRVTIAALIAAACLLGALAAHHRAVADPGGVLRSDDGDTVRITPEIRAAGLRFSPEVSAGDRAWILAAIAKARPAARRLISEVDGTVVITTAGQARPGVMGWTQPSPTGFHVWLNVGLLDGFRSIDRDVTVLHELGHVVDFALIPKALDARLDAGIPQGGACLQQDGAGFGGCAAPEERIADTFAKWALGGAVSAVGAGYAIGAPASIEDWGAPLTQLSVTLPR